MIFYILICNLIQDHVELCSAVRARYRSNDNSTARLLQAPYLPLTRRNEKSASGNRTLLDYTTILPAYVTMFGSHIVVRSNSSLQGEIVEPRDSLT